MDTEITLSLGKIIALCLSSFAVGLSLCAVIIAFSIGKKH